MPVSLDLDIALMNGYVRQDDGRSAYTLQPAGVTYGQVSCGAVLGLRVTIGNPDSGPVCREQYLLRKSCEGIAK